MAENDTELVVAYTSSGAEELAKKIPNARLVLAFNTLLSEILSAFTKPWARAKPID